MLVLRRQDPRGRRGVDPLEQRRLVRPVLPEVLPEMVGDDRMSKTRALCVMVQLETDDPHMSPKALERALEDADATVEMRRTILAHMPQDITRLIAIFPVEHARLLMMVHEIYGASIVAHLREHGFDVPGFVERMILDFARPPASYKRPP